MRVLAKLRLRDRTQAAVLAYETGLVVPARVVEPGGAAAAGLLASGARVAIIIGRRSAQVSSPPVANPGTSNR